MSSCTSNDAAARSASRETPAPAPGVRRSMNPRDGEPSAGRNRSGRERARASHADCDAHRDAGSAPAAATGASIPPVGSVGCIDAGCADAMTCARLGWLQGPNDNSGNAR